MASPLEDTFYSVIAWTLALAACAKLSSSFFELQWGWSAAGVSALIVVELAVAFMLLTSQRRPAVKVVTCMLFCCFLLFAGKSYFDGLASCSCFGRLHIPPVVLVIFDSLAIAILLLTIMQHSWSRLVVSQVLAGVLVLTIMSFCYYSSALWHLEQRSGLSMFAKAFDIPEKFTLNELLASCDGNGTGEVALIPSAGKAAVVFLRPDCNQCDWFREMKLARLSAVYTNVIRLELLEDAQVGSLDGRGATTYTKVLDDYDFVPVPTVFVFANQELVEAKFPSELVGVKHD